MATMRPTPRNELLGLLSDAYQWMQSPERTQQMQGFAGLLGTTGVPQTVERMAYGEPLTNIGRANVPLLKPETADALMTVAPIAKPAAVMAGRTGRAVGRMAGEEINAAMTGQPTRSLLGEITPKPLRMSDTSYRGSHTAPGPDFGAPLYDLSQMYPADVYSEKAAQYYGSGNKRADIEAFNLAKRVRGNPDAEVTIYRAVPKNADISNINAGDWVTLTKDYAKGHGESVLRGDYKILSQKVKAKDLWTNADSIQEFGYQPQKLNAPQQAALDLAQKRAALPVEQGGLGLPSNNTAADRAKAMGFDLNTTRFHGSDQDIYAFDPAKFGKNDQGWYGRGVTTDTDPEVASSYAENYVGDGQVVYPLVSRGKYMQWPEGQQPFSTAKDAIQGTKDIQNLGYQGTQFTSDRDLYGSMPQFGTEQVTFDPANIRSRFAAFDPFRKDVATATAMGVALPDLLAAELPEEELKRNQSAGLLFP